MAASAQKSAALLALLKQLDGLTSSQKDGLILARMPSGSRVVRFDEIVVRDGETVAQFPATSTVSETGRGLVVTDSRDAEVHRFSTSASVERIADGMAIYLPPGRTLPAFAATSTGSVR